MTAPGTTSGITNMLLELLEILVAVILCCESFFDYKW